MSNWPGLGGSGRPQDLRFFAGCASIPAALPARAGCGLPGIMFTLLPATSVSAERGPLLNAINSVAGICTSRKAAPLRSAPAPRCGRLGRGFGLRRRRYGTVRGGGGRGGGERGREKNAVAALGQILGSNKWRFQDESTVTI